MAEGLVVRRGGNPFKLIPIKEISVSGQKIFVPASCFTDVPNGANFLVVATFTANDVLYRGCLYFVKLNSGTVQVRSTCTGLSSTSYTGDGGWDTNESTAYFDVTSSSYSSVELHNGFVYIYE